MNHCEWWPAPFLPVFEPLSFHPWQICLLVNRSYEPQLWNKNNRMKEMYHTAIQRLLKHVRYEKWESFKINWAVLIYFTVIRLFYLFESMLSWFAMKRLALVATSPRSRCWKLTIESLRMAALSVEFPPKISSVPASSCTTENS